MSRHGVCQGHRREPGRGRPGADGGEPARRDHGGGPGDGGPAAQGVSLNAGALSGLRVVELGEFVSAPYCGRLLAGLGADVVKVEPPQGDRARRHGPFSRDEPHPERSGLFLALNMGKRGVLLDLDRPDGRARLERLLDEADCLVENLPVERLERLRLTPEETQRRWPRLVHVSITAFGRRGPYARLRGHALQASAAGAASITIGEPDRAPLPLPVSQPDYQGGVNGAIGALLACFARELTGRGQHVDIATADVVAFSGGITSTMYTAQGLPWGREGHRAPRSGGYYPYTILPCKDGFLCMITRSGHPWKKFVEAMGSPAWTRQARYQDRALMGREYPDEVDALLAAWLEQRTRQELLALFRERGIPFSVVRDAGDVATCPQLGARDFFVEVDHPAAGALRYPGAPWKLSRTPWRVDRPAPLLGEHSPQFEPRGVGEAVASPPRGEARQFEPRGVGEAVASPPRGEARLKGTLRPLEGIRVVDFGWVAVGPVLASVLADFGAEVIKVESSRRLDYCRLIPRPVLEGERQDRAYASRAEEIDTVPMFHNYNRGKLGVTVNLRHPGAGTLLKRLVATADVVVENFSPRVLREMGLDYDALVAVRPDLVMISCSAAGQDGPWNDLKTFAPALSSLAGLEVLIGYAGERVLGELAFGYADPSNAHHGCLAVLAALWHRRRTGQGQYIDMSQLEATVGLAVEPLMDWFMNGRASGPQGAAHRSMAPHGNYPCRGADQWVSIAVEDDAAWSRLADTLGDPGLREEPRFAPLAGRLAHASELDARLAEWTRRRTPWEATEALQRAGVAAFPVYGLAEQAEDPHFRARGLIATPKHPRLGTVPVFAHPIKLSDTPGEVRTPAPMLGEHNARVFQELLGLAPAEIERLAAAGVIA
ncbi:MAG: CoA transferase [Candidatus Rokubacteria bacterium]|nr:CoA transferase [Candidatus Rokubacteria bacterium]